MSAKNVDDPVASVLVPCWNTAPWVDAALDSALAAADRLAPRTAEIVCVDDGSTDGTAERLAARAAADPRIRIVTSSGFADTRPNLGVSAARNALLDAARGTYLFWMDPDDTVAPDFLTAGVDAMERTGADWCVFPYRLRHGEAEPFHKAPLKGDYRFTDNDAVLDGFVPRLIGFSFADLRRWYAGEALFDPRELGAVWRCVYRRAIIERYHVRFDKALHFWEDSIFNCEYLLHVSRTTTVDHPLYDYTIRDTGWTARGERSAALVANKFALLAARKHLDTLSGGRFAPLFAGSCTLAPLEILGTFRKTSIGLFGAIRSVRSYLRDPFAASCVWTCPLSWRRPVFSAAVWFLRVLTP